MELVRSSLFPKGPPDYVHSLPFPPEHGHSPKICEVFWPKEDGHNVQNTSQIYVTTLPHYSQNPSDIKKDKTLGTML